MTAQWLPSSWVCQLAGGIRRRLKDGAPLLFRSWTLYPSMDSGCVDVVEKKDTNSDGQLANAGGGGERERENSKTKSIS